MRNVVPHLALAFAALSAGGANAAGPRRVAGTYALDEPAMRAAAEAAPAAQREKAQSRLEFLTAMKPALVLREDGTGEGSFEVPVGDRAGETQSFPIKWVEEKGKLILEQPESTGAASITCLPEGNRLRCNEGEALVIYARR